MCVCVCAGQYLCVSVCVCLSNRLFHNYIDGLRHVFLHVCDLRGAVAGHLLAACLQYGQVLASAVSRLVSAAAATPFLPQSSPLISPSLPLTDVATPPPLSFLWAQPVLTLNICPGGACSVLTRGGGGLKKRGVGFKPDTHTHFLCV